MSKLPWTPWHKVVTLRPDLESGELSMSMFAADLYDVVMGKARPVYQAPREFFSLTYPTFNLRELARDVVTRLAGRSDKAVRQLELTYGGGKTHTLIALYHLVKNPPMRPDLPAVREFTEHIGIPVPQARVAVLAFDKLDAEKGMEVRSPQGEARWLKNPWSVLAFQLAGTEGLRLLHADGEDRERDSAPAENLLVDLLAWPGREGLATLILIDEVLMYVREKVGLDPAWRGRIIDFFQYLTQAATKVDSCAVVASLLATDPRKSDTLGRELTQELYSVFRREREEGVQPVVKEDVAEVLRRRFFVADSICNREAFRPHVVAALKGIADLDEQTRKDMKSTEDKFVLSYPFHPDLTDVFYTKWTNLEGFQRTRGILRTFALALRDARGWDMSPLVSAAAFLGRPDPAVFSESSRELTSIAETEEYEGKRQDWSFILQGELEKARDIQNDFSALRHREMESAVLATFLHSQPVGRKATTRELLVLLGATRPDRIELEKALFRWAEVSWFLDEMSLNDASVDAAGRKTLPRSWRLGSRPNLRQMHHAACLGISPELVESRLIDGIDKAKNLTAGAAAAGVRVHTLPRRPADIEDDGDFHYVVLGPRAVSESGKPGPEARRYLEEKTGPDAPRVYRNALVVAVPSRDGLEVARNRIREHLAWEEVNSQLSDQEVDAIRRATLDAELSSARQKIPDAIEQAYCIVVTVSEKNEVEAFKITAGDEPLFNRIKADKRSRIRETAVSADALMPGGPYDLWRDDEKSRRAKDLVGAFAQHTRLPKMLRAKEILDTLVLGAVDGIFVLQVTRPDRTVRTFWHQKPDDSALKDSSLEVVLPQAALLTEIQPTLLAPDALPGLWTGSRIPFRDIVSYFGGGRVVKVQKDGYEEPAFIPTADRATVEAAVQVAVHDGKLWLTSGPATVYAEEIPVGILTDDAVLQAPPSRIAVADVLPDNLPGAWVAGATTPLAVSVALSKKHDAPLPWKSIRDGLDGAIRARLLERTPDSGPWPCDFAGAQAVKLRIPQEAPPSLPPPLPLPPPAPQGVLVARAELRSNQIQDLADQIGEISRQAVGCDLKFHLRIELGGPAAPSEEVRSKVNALLQGVSPDLQLT